MSRLTLAAVCDFLAQHGQDKWPTISINAKDVAANIEELEKVMKNVIMAEKFNGRNIEARCKQLRYLLAVLQAIPETENLLRFVGNKIQAVQNKNTQAGYVP
jgi:hypothetical protein